MMDIGQLLSEIRGTPAPSQPPEPETALGPLPTLQISAAGSAARSERTVTTITGIGAIFIGLYLMLAVQGFLGVALVIGAGIMTARSQDLKIRFKSDYDSARSAWDEQRKVWLVQAGPEKFERKKSHYLSLERDHAGLPAKERAKLNALEQKKRELQLVKHLKSHLIDRANIPRIGEGRKATLVSYGIENAWDVRKKHLENVQGFGPSLVGELEKWGRSIESKFVFDASIPTDPQAIQAIKTEIGRQRAEIERELSNGPADLRRLADEANAYRRSPPKTLSDAYFRLKQVELDMG